MDDIMNKEPEKSEKNLEKTSIYKDLPSDELRKPKEERARGFIRIPIFELVENPDNPRQYFSVERMEELKNQIIQAGRIIHPLIVVYSSKTGEYVIKDGMRRYRAILELNEEGYDFKTLPCHILKNISESDGYILSIMANDGEQLNKGEQARAIHRLIDFFGLSAEEVSKKLGLAKQVVNLRYNLWNDATEEMRNLLIKGELNISTAADFLKKGIVEPEEIEEELSLKNDKEAKKIQKEEENFRHLVFCDIVSDSIDFVVSKNPYVKEVWNKMKLDKILTIMKTKCNYEKYMIAARQWSESTDQPYKYGYDIYNPDINKFGIDFSIPYIIEEYKDSDDDADSNELIELY